jgi:hypothetical protein
MLLLTVVALQNYKTYFSYLIKLCVFCPTFAHSPAATTTTTITNSC